jgi:hypothetical protein
MKIFYWSNTDGKVRKRLVGFDPRVRQIFSTFQAKKQPVSIYQQLPIANKRK